MNSEITKTDISKAKSFFRKLSNIELEPLLLLTEQFQNNKIIRNLCNIEKNIIDQINENFEAIGIDPFLFSLAYSHYQKNLYLNIYKNENSLSDAISIYLNKFPEFAKLLVNLFFSLDLPIADEIIIDRESSLFDSTSFKESGRVDIKISFNNHNASKIIFIEHKIFHKLSKEQLVRYCKSASTHIHPYFLLLTSKDVDIDILKSNRKLLEKYFKKIVIINHIDLAKLFYKIYSRGNINTGAFFISWLYAVGKSFFGEANISRSVDSPYFRNYYINDNSEKENMVNIFRTKSYE